MLRIFKHIIGYDGLYLNFIKKLVKLILREYINKLAVKDVKDLILL